MMVAVASAEPLVVGRFYEVPCVFYPWFGRKEWWPVIGHRHSDKRFLNFPHVHYHVDGRFLTAPQARFATRYGRPLTQVLAASPLHTRGEETPAVPTMKRRRCRVAAIPYGFPRERLILGIAEHYAGHQCRASEHGWVCPHQHVPLGSVAPINGVVTCPLHGLCIDAATGVVLPAGENHG